MKNLKLISEHREVKTQVVVVSSDSFSQLVWEISLRCKLLCLFEFLFIFDGFLVSVVYLNSEVCKKSSVDARASDHNEYVHKVLKIGGWDDITVSKTSHSCHGVKHCINEPFQFRYFSDVVFRSFTTVLCHNEPILSVGINSSNYKPNASDDMCRKKEVKYDLKCPHVERHFLVFHLIFNFLCLEEHLNLGESYEFQSSQESNCQG